MKKLFYILILITLSSCIVIDTISYSFSKEHKNYKRDKNDFITNYSNYYWEGELNKNKYKLIVDSVYNEYVYNGKLIINTDTLIIKNHKGNVSVFNDTIKKYKYCNYYNFANFDLDTMILLYDTNQRYYSEREKITLLKKEDYFHKPFLQKELISIQPRFKGNRKFAPINIQYYELKNKSSIFSIIDGNVTKVGSGIITITNEDLIINYFSIQTNLKKGNKISKGQKLGVPLNEKGILIDNVFGILILKDSVELNPNIIFNKNENLTLSTKD